MPKCAKTQLKFEKWFYHWHLRSSQVNGDHEKPSPADDEAAAKKKEAEEELYARMQNKLNEVVKEKEALMQKINNDQEQ